MDDVSICVVTPLPLKVSLVWLAPLLLLILLARLLLSASLLNQLLAPSLPYPLSEIKHHPAYALKLNCYLIQACMGVLRGNDSLGTLPTKRAGAVICSILRDEPGSHPVGASMLVYLRL